MTSPARAGQQRPRGRANGEGSIFPYRNGYAGYVWVTTPAGERGKQLYRVPDAMRILSMSRSVIYEQLRSGRLRSVHQGRARRIPASAITEYIALLEHEARSAA